MSTTDESAILDPIALHDASTCTDEDLHYMALTSAAQGFTSAELSAIKEGMTTEQIERVRQYIPLYSQAIPDPVNIAQPNNHGSIAGCDPAAHKPSFPWCWLQPIEWIDLANAL